MVFPMTDPNGNPSFGVGCVESITNGQLSMHWYGNRTDDPFGTFLPLWMGPDNWYPQKTKRHPDHEKVLTSDYYPQVISQDSLADVGFQLDADDKLPLEVLQHISRDPEYLWSLSDDIME